MKPETQHVHVWRHRKWISKYYSHLTKDVRQMKIKTLNLSVKWNSCGTQVKLSIKLNVFQLCPPETRRDEAAARFTAAAATEEATRPDRVNTAQFTGHNIKTQPRPPVAALSSTKVPLFRILLQVPTLEAEWRHSRGLLGKPPVRSRTF